LLPREWYGTALFDHPSPAPTSILRRLFPTYSESYTPAIIPAPSGESIEHLYDRTAYALARVIAQLDTEEGQPKTVLLCTHAATLIATGRTLTGHLPEHVQEDDFKPFTCSLSKFVRRKELSGNIKFTGTVRAEEGIPEVDWRNGRGIGGGWDCVINGDCSFLKGGEERGW
jgi:transcription factor C subunit 7